MYYVRFFTLTLIFSLFALKGFSQQGGLFHKEDMEFLMSKKPAKLMIFFADWCGPCQAAQKAMKENVALKRIVDSYEVLQYDFDVAIPMRRKYNVDRVPTFIIVSEDEELRRQVGFSSTEKLKNFLD
jgi:thiol-disulfide isomerase/thioredoxin